MLKAALSVLAVAVLALSVGATGAEAKSKKKMAKAAATPGTCTASAYMPDHMRFFHCHPMTTAKK